ncbi:hypothetical protein QYE76_012595 [Lolium multiflorum]|uniref:Retrotransposon Copia-like N-terminal domain-containing protein n=1 Tax=Lolium multiflorum TaxID=4521 RepID=A0AAD8X3T4_LOLMU|nr:hypothetical protein QYE76_012595 [Lolium multiflorum]
MSSSSSFVPSSATQAGVVTEKLSGDNFPLWRAQVMPPLRERQLVGFLDGKVPQPAETHEIESTNTKGEKEKQIVPNPADASWVAQDQQVLGFLLSSLSRGVLTQVSALETMADVWVALTAMYSSQSRAQVMQIGGGQWWRLHLHRQSASVVEAATAIAAAMEAAEDAAMVAAVVADDPQV